MMKKLLFLPFFMAGALFPVVPSSAADSTSAQDFVRRRQQAVSVIVSDKVNTPAQKQARRERLDKALQDFLSYDELAKRSLGKHWGSLKPAQRKLFTNLLTELIQTSYKRNLEKTLNFKVRYETAEETAEGTLVKTVATPIKERRAESVNIHYALLPHPDGGWRVYDIITDDVSLVRNYRSQFDRIIKKSGWDSLIKKMRDRVGREDRS